MSAAENIELTDYSTLEDGAVIRAPLADIDPLPGGNVRKRRDEKSFADLRAAIRNDGGVTQSVTVRINPDNPSRLQLIAGYGRFEASKFEGFADIPAVFRVANDRQAEAMMLSENFAREELSIADEIVAAQRFISHFDGNYAAAAAELNWSETRLRGRLLLNQCTEQVLEALRNGDILLGHAEILSAFTPKLQDGTLAKIIDEQWSLEYLKERAGKANRVLKNAIFDTADCAQCPNNSDMQASLFDNTVGKAKCNNLVCFKEKTDAVLAKRKAEIEEEYGVVLLAIEKPATDRNTVSAEVVGEKQFADGCTGCESKITILQDGINSDAGTVTPNQCIDSECFRKMKAAHEKPAPKAKASGQGGKAAPAAKGAESKAPAKGKDAPVQKTPAALVEQHKNALRQIGAAHFKSNAHFREAIAVAAMVDKAGLRNSPDDYPVLKGIVVLGGGINKLVTSLYSKAPEELAEIKQAVFEYYLTAASSELIDNQRSLVITTLAGDSQGKSLAVSAWTPTVDTLSGYRKDALERIAEKSGYQKAYDEKHGEGAFAKVAKKTKKELVKALLETDFDWSEFAPEDYLGCLK